MLTQYQNISFPNGQKLLLLPPICLDLNSANRLLPLERSTLQLDMSWYPAQCPLDYRTKLEKNVKKNIVGCLYECFWFVGQASLIFSAFL